MTYWDRVVLDLREWANRHEAAAIACVFAIVAGVVLLALGRRIVGILSRRRRVQRLFADLAAANQLTPDEQELLLDMAADYRLSNPTLLFVSPSRVRGYSALAEARARGADPAGLAQRVASLAEKLFA
jgi:hypothetical protein